MSITMTTPALLFPAISLLLVAYTNRFNALSSRIRALNSQNKAHPEVLLQQQINSLRKRIYLVRNMQGFGVAGLFLCIMCMIMLFLGANNIGQFSFGTSLLLMLGSLAFSLQEIFISVNALELEIGADIG